MGMGARCAQAVLTARQAASAIKARRLSFVRAGCWCSRKDEFVPLSACSLIISLFLVSWFGNHTLVLLAQSRAV
jgi:hypothetical protein